MKWQKTARIAIAIVVVAFTAVVFLTLRRNRPTAPAEGTPRRDPTSKVESTGAIEYKQYTKDGKLTFALRAELHTTYTDGRTVLTKAHLTLPDRGGRTLVISSDEMETTAPADKPGEIGTARMTKNVRMEASDGLVVTAGEATYDQTSGMIKVPGDVQFSRARLKGTGVGATYDQNREVLWLLKDARVSVAADEKGQGAAEGSAVSAGFARGDHYIRLTGSARITGDGRDATADDITIQLSEDEKRITTMQLRGNSRIAGTGAGALTMASRDIDLTYGADGKAIQNAILTENSSLNLPGPNATAGPRIAGRNISIALAPDGSTVTNLTATEKVQVDLPARANSPVRRITATSLAGQGTPDGGLRTATFAGPVEFRETRPAGRGTPASERVARSQRLIVETEPGFGDLRQADFRTNVRFEDGPTTAEAPRGLYSIVKDTLDLSTAAGESGPSPRIVDERMSVDAVRLTLTLESRKLVADTNVRSSLQGSQEGRKGPTNGKQDSGKLPSMLKSDEPVFVNANRLEYDGSSTATYSGEARLFQGQTTVAGDTVVLDDRNGNLTAIGHARSVMFLDDVDPKTKVRKSTQTTGTGEQLVYEEAKRLATYTTGPTANAHIVGPQGDLTADTIQLFLKAKLNELERAEADVKVVVVEGLRRAKGDHLTYTSSDETYLMKGNPLEVDRRTPGECSRTMGVTLRFRRGDDTLVVDGIPGVTPFNTKPIPCS